MEHKHSAERRQHIYDAAINLFKEQGYNKTKISDICEAAGVPVGSIYHYYKNKASFLLDYAKTLGTKGHQILDDSDLDENPVEVLSKYYIYKASILDEAGHILCRNINDQFNSIWMSNHEYNEYSGVRCLTPFLEKRIAAGQFNIHYSAEDAAWLMQALFQGCVSYWLQMDGTIELKDITEERFLPIVIENLTRS